MSVRDDWDRWAPGERLVIALLVASLIVATAVIAFRPPPKQPISEKDPPKVEAAAPNTSKVAFPGAPVSINQAGQSELESLPGVGPELAREIIQDRIRNGPYTSLDQLGRVKGIGPRKLEQLRGRIRL